MNKLFYSICITAPALFISPCLAKPTGSFFNVTSSGSTLTIRTTTPHHSYPKAGIHIITPGVSLAHVGTECKMANTGYCLFAVSDTQPALLTLSGTATRISITLALNGDPATQQEARDIEFSPAACPPAHIIDGLCWVQRHNTLNAQPDCSAACATLSFTLASPTNTQPLATQVLSAFGQAAPTLSPVPPGVTYTIANINDTPRSSAWGANNGTNWEWPIGFYVPFDYYCPCTIT